MNRRTQTSLRWNESKAIEGGPWWPSTGDKRKLLGNSMQTLRKIPETLQLLWNFTDLGLTSFGWLVLVAKPFLQARVRLAICTQAKCTHNRKRTNKQKPHDVPVYAVWPKDFPVVFVLARHHFSLFFIFQLNFGVLFCVQPQTCRTWYDDFAHIGLIPGEVTQASCV